MAVEIVNALSAHLVTPTPMILETPEGQYIAASNLKMNTSKTEGHFFSSKLQDSILGKILTTMKEDINFFDYTIHLGRIFDAQSEVFKNKSRLQEMSNEADVRYAICNPIMNMVCDIMNYKLKLEVIVKDCEIVKEEEEEIVDMEIMAGEFFSCIEKMSTSATSATSATSRRSIGGTMSKQNKADYAVYALHSNGRRKIVAIVDAKYKLGLHAIAQVIGYYAAFNIDADLNPIAMVISQDFIQFVIFPFRDKDQPLINAVSLDHIYLWEEENVLNRNLLKLLLAFLKEDSGVQRVGLSADSIPAHARIQKNRITKCVVEDEKTLLHKVIEDRDKVIKDRDKTIAALTADIGNKAKEISELKEHGGVSEQDLGLPLSKRSRKNH